MPLGKCKLNCRQAAGNCKQPGCPAPCTCRSYENQGWGYRIKTSPARAYRHSRPHGNQLHTSVSSVWTCKHYFIPEEISLIIKFSTHTLPEVVFIGSKPRHALCSLKYYFKSSSHHLSYSICSINTNTFLAGAAVCLHAKFITWISTKRRALAVWLYV